MADPDLTPVIVQDADTGRVLMLAYADEEALRRTRETGEAWFWSRSRRELWHKGATSGNVQRVRALRLRLRRRRAARARRPGGTGLPHGREKLLLRGRARAAGDA